MLSLHNDMYLLFIFCPIFRDQYNKSIQEQETKTKVLKDEQKEVKENQAYNEKQMYMWSNLQKLLECKKKCREDENNSKKSVSPGMTDRLVL